MNRSVRKVIAILGLAACATVGGAVASTAISNVSFARAEREVVEARSSLENVADLSNAFKQVSRAVEPSVVQIKTMSPGQMGSLNFRRMFPFTPDQLPEGFPMPQLPDADGGGEEPGLTEGTGSGVIMEVSGGEAFILTNNHVVANAKSISIVLADGRTLKNSKVVGTDPRTDLAVVKVTADKLIPAKWGDSAKLEKGDWVVAFGSPFGYVGSMTHGIVSALNRQVGILGTMGYEDFIQTDAPINPGNSGGPLVSLRGEVIGINSAILSRTGSFSGIGLAIPANLAKPVYERLKTDGKMTRGWLGVSIADVAGAEDEVKEAIASVGYKGETGVFISNILRNGPAEGSLKAGDVVTAIDGKPVASSRDLRENIAVVAPGKEVRLSVFREGKTIEEKVKLGEQPDDAQLAMNFGQRQRQFGQTVPEAALGLGLQTLTEPLARRNGIDTTATGAIITQVQPNSSAFRAGLRPGDLITGVNGKEVQNAEEAATAINGADLAKGVRLNVTNREGSRFILIRERR